MWDLNQYYNFNRIYDSIFLCRNYVASIDFKSVVENFDISVAWKEIAVGSRGV